METQTAVLRNIQNGDLYRHVSGNTFRNLRTLKEGNIEPELASRVLRVNVNASFLINDNEVLEVTIHRLQMRLDVNT